jgi:GMP synthase-like glutamine amidotransferase
MATVLVIENAPEWHLGKLADWLAATQLRPQLCRPHAGDELPSSVEHEALIALGGGRGADWSDQLTALLRNAVAQQTPTLAFCSSARALSAAFGGLNRPVADFQPGPRLLARRDAAGDDPLFAIAPMALDVVSWRHEELAELPPEATLLASSPHGQPDVFRIGDRAWGIQSHVELDGEMIAAIGGDADIALRVDAVTEHLFDTWSPIVSRFAALACGRTAGTPLPLIDS